MLDCLCPICMGIGCLAFLILITLIGYKFNNYESIYINYNIFRGDGDTMTKLILLRGISGSGKTTIARKLQSMLGNGVMRVGQDVIRRYMLNVSDRPGNLSIELIKYITLFGITYCKYVIVEGIFNKGKYGNML